MATRKELDDLSCQVYDLRCQGIRPTKIALFLGIPQSKVYRLLEKVKQHHRWLADHLDAKNKIGQILDDLDKQSERARANALACRIGSSAAVWWERLHQDCLKEIKKIMHECGLLENKAPLPQVSFIQQFNSIQMSLKELNSDDLKVVLKLGLLKQEKEQEKQKLIDI
jgi:hypothetical protein